MTGIGGVFPNFEDHQLDKKKISEFFSSIVNLEKLKLWAFWTSKSAKPSRCYELAKWGGHKWSKKKWLFSAFHVSKRAWNGPKNCWNIRFGRKISSGIHWTGFQSSISCHFGRNGQFMLISILIFMTRTRLDLTSVGIGNGIWKWMIKHFLYILHL